MEKLVFETSMRSLADASRSRLSPKAQAELKALGLDPAPEAALLPAYPAEQWARCVRLVAADLYPSDEPAEGQRKVAHAVTDVFANTLVARTMFSVVRLLGPDRNLKRMTKNFRNGCNFLEVEARNVSMEPRVDEMVFNDVSGVPGFYWGLLEAAGRHSFDKAMQVELVRTDGTQAVYRRTFSK